MGMQPGIEDMHHHRLTHTVDGGYRRAEVGEKAGLAVDGEILRLAVGPGGAERVAQELLHEQCCRVLQAGGKIAHLGKQVGAGLVVDMGILAEGRRRIRQTEIGVPFFPFQARERTGTEGVVQVLDMGGRVVIGGEVVPAGRLVRPDHQGAVQSHDPVDRLIQVVVVQMSARLVDRKGLRTKSISRVDGTTVENARNKEGVRLIKGIDNGDGNIITFNGINRRARAVHRYLRPVSRIVNQRHLVDPKVAAGVIDSVVGHHFLDGVGYSDLQGLGAGGKGVFNPQKRDLAADDNGRHARRAQLHKITSVHFHNILRAKHIL